MREIRSLTGIRGLACLFVMFYHYSDRRIGTGIAKTVIDHGYLCLDMFFILSGFVMAFTYRGMFDAGINRRAFIAFFGRRVARIYPLYFIVTMVMVAVILAGKSVYLTPHQLWPVLIPNLLLVQAWIGQLSIDFPAWSISAEWAAYAAFPWLLILALRGSATRAVATGIGSAAILVLVALLPGWTLDHAQRHGSLNVFYGFGMPLLRCFGEFMLGLLAFRISETATGRFIAETSLVGVAVLAVTAICFMLPHSDLPLVGCFVLLIIAISSDRGPAARIFTHQISYRLGEWSYAIYLLHPHAGRLSIAIEAYARRHHLPFPILTSLIPAMIVTIALAAIVHPTIEKPGRKFIQKLVSRPAKAKLPAGAGSAGSIG